MGQETWRVGDYQLTGENGVYVIGHGEPNSERLVDDALEVMEPIIRLKVNGKRGVGWVEFAQDRVGWRQLVNAGRKFGNEVARGAKAAGGRRNPEEARGGGQNFSF